MRDILSNFLDPISRVWGTRQPYSDLAHTKECTLKKAVSKKRVLKANFKKKKKV